VTLSIIIPQYRTERWIRLCLRSLRKYTQTPVQVIVVDNGSGDESTAYLRGVEWIELIENGSGATGSRAQWEAFDLGMARATGDWLGFFHSDTIVLRPGWDAYLLGRLEAANAVGLSASDRDVNAFEARGDRWKRNLHDALFAVKQRLRGGRTSGKILSYCLFLQARFWRDAGVSFAREEGDAATTLYRRVIEGRHPFLFLGRGELEPFLWHTSNVTSIVTGQMTEASLLAKFQAKSRSLWERVEIQSVFADESLDR
jgi:glycosyltransferase involved in cell wall biosynthesis